MIYKIEHFVNDKEEQVIRKTPECEEGEEGWLEVIHMGVFSVSLDTLYGPQDAQLQFEFPKAYTLEDCFKNFDKLAKQEYERVLNEIRDKSKQNMILTPDEKGGIIIP